MPGKGRSDETQPEYRPQRERQGFIEAASGLEGSCRLAVIDPATSTPAGVSSLFAPRSNWRSWSRAPVVKYQSRRRRGESSRLIRCRARSRGSLIVQERGRRAGWRSGLPREYEQFWLPLRSEPFCDVAHLGFACVPATPGGAPARPHCVGEGKVHTCSRARRGCARSAR